MSTPQEPHQGEQPPTPPPGSYGVGYGGTIYPYEGRTGDAAQQGYPYGAGQPVQPPSLEKQPYPYPQQPYAPPPAGLDPADAATAPRPPAMLLALVLQLVAALPFLFGGIALATAPGSVAALFPQDQIEAAIPAGSELTPEQFAELLPEAISLFGVLMIVVSVLYVLLAVVAFTGRNWARVLVAVMSVGFGLLLAVNALLALLSADPLGFVVAGGLAAAVIVPVVVLFRRPANAFFSRVRR